MELLPFQFQELCVPCDQLFRASEVFRLLLFFDFAVRVCPICFDDAATETAVDGFFRIVLAAGRFAGVAGAISMTNSSEKSSPAVAG